MVTSVPESYCFRTPFDSKRVQGSQTLLKPALQDLYSSFPLTVDKLSWKTSPLVRFKILGLSGNMLTADHMYSRHTLEKVRQQVQTLLPENWKRFSEIFFDFYNLHKILRIWKKKVSFIA